MTADVHLFGAYLYPPHLVALDLPDPDDEGATAVWKSRLAECGHRVVRAFSVGPRTVRVTHSGGVFVDGNLADFFDRKHEFVETINLVLCNLNLQEAATCGPVSPTDLGMAMLSNEEAWIGAAATHIQTFRNLAVLDAVRRQHPLIFRWPQISSEALDRAVESDHAQRLADIAPSVPELVATAAFHADRGRPAEALVTAYIVVEQIIGHIWRRRVESGARDDKHRRRLRDNRTFTASVKTEVLWRSGCLSDQAYDAMERARSARNKLAHDAQLDTDARNVAIHALNAAINLGIHVHW